MLLSTRSHAQSLIRAGRVSINGNVSSTPGSDVRETDNVALTDQTTETPRLNIIYSDDDIAVINKPAGHAMHAGPGHEELTTIVGALRQHFPCLSQSNTREPGLVHRLDKDTSGLCVIAKHDQAHKRLQAQIQDGDVERCYIGAVAGSFKNNPQEQVWEDWIGRGGRQKMRITTRETPFAKRAKTAVQVLLPGTHNLNLAHFKLFTGVHHQIRCQASARGHPIIGDALYARQKADKMLLHSYKLSLLQPVSGSRLEFKAMPDWLYEDEILNSQI